MAAGLLEAAAGDRIDVHSAGMRPGAALNAQSVEALLEVGIDISTHEPKPIDPALLASVDVVVTLGSEAKVEPVDGPRFETWETDEPSERGIEGAERMRLVRDDIARRVALLAAELAPVTDAGGRSGSSSDRNGAPPVL